MARVNLLPWREALRKERQRNFLIALGAAVLAAGGVVFSVHAYVADLIDRQNQRNAFLQQQIRVVNQKISEIKRLEDERKALLDRMAIIQRLQTSRPEIVHLFDELPRLLPEGVFLTSLAQKNRVVTLSGVAQSNARVSSFMRNLDGSEWLTDPVLEVIKSVELEGPPPQRVAEFTLAVKQVNPQAKDEDTSGGAE